ncbi:hypothetical protein GCM10027452_01070 [Micromonospora halotolerans]
MDCLSGQASSIWPGDSTVHWVAGRGLVVEATKWERTYVDSQVRLHRSQLAELAANHRAGTLPPDAVSPWRLR